MSEREPVAVPTAMVVWSITGQCPTCEREHDAEAEQFGPFQFFVPDETRYVLCECGTLIDLGAGSFMWSAAA